MRNTTHLRGNQVVVADLLSRESILGATVWILGVVRHGRNVVLVVRAGRLSTVRKVARARAWIRCSTSVEPLGGLHRLWVPSHMVSDPGERLDL